MNNVGVLGIMMPIAIHSFTEIKKSPSIILMPIAFCSVLGGLITAMLFPNSNCPSKQHHGYGAMVGIGFLIILDWGLPLEIIILAVSIPSILWAWPL